MNTNPWPRRAADVALRIIATTDLLGTVVPLPTSYGSTGSIDTIAAQLTREREHGPSLWLDAGDLTAGPASALTGAAVWPALRTIPIDAATAGNHEFDEGIPTLLKAANTLPFPLLCADRDIDLPPSTLLTTPAGPVGVIGISHPQTHQLASAVPHRLPNWAAAIRAQARALRQRGARWVIALAHDGVTWWNGTAPEGVRTRTDQLEHHTAEWANAVDVIVAGHTLTAWTGDLHGTPAGQPYAFATGALIIDLRTNDSPPNLTLVRVPAETRNRSEVEAADRVRAAAGATVGFIPDAWYSRAGESAATYLPNLIAEAFADAAAAGFVPSSQLFTQAPVDGTVAALAAGPITELDIYRLFPFADDEPVLVHLRPHELDRLTAAHDSATTPGNVATDGEWWNWARLPAGTASTSPRATAMLVMPYFLPLLAGWLGRTPSAEPTGLSGRELLRRRVAA